MPDLIEISNLVNLVTLEIINYSDPRHSVVSDILVKAWSLCACQKKSFQVLRVLRLWNHWEITPKSLEYLLHFPALSLCDMRGCNLERSNSRKCDGWKYVGNKISLTSQKNECFKGLNCRNCVSKVSTQESTQGKPRSESGNSKTHMLIDMICQVRNIWYLEPFNQSASNFIFVTNKSRIVLLWHAFVLDLPIL